MKIRRRNQFKDKSYLRHLDCLFWTILNHIGGLKYRHFRQDSPAIRVANSEIEDFILIKMTLSKLGGIKDFPTLHTSLLISKSLGVEI